MAGDLGRLWSCDRSPPWILADPRWNFYAVGGRSHHQSRSEGSVAYDKGAGDIARKVDVVGIQQPDRAAGLNIHGR